MSLHVWHASAAWSWLGGHVRPGEDPEDAVRRELAEELDAQGVRVVRLLGVVDTHIDTSRWFGPRYERGHLGYHYLVTVESPDVSVVDHEELTRVEWLTLDQVAEAIATLPQEIREADLGFVRQAVKDVTTRSAAE
jgi:ADP-ribose pyrophosphatase YjhB (NUDIX family)